MTTVKTASMTYYDLRILYIAFSYETGDLIPEIDFRVPFTHAREKKIKVSLT